RLHLILATMIAPTFKASLLAAALVLTCPGADAQTKDAGFVPLFDGKTLKGWHVSGKTGHSRASKNQTGGRWVVENGAIVGSQDIPGNGGNVITDKPYGNLRVRRAVTH